jgi:hypothetical protein
MEYNIGNKGIRGQGSKGIRRKEELESRFSPSSFLIPPLLYAPIVLLFLLIKVYLKAKPGRERQDDKDDSRKLYGFTPYGLVAFIFIRNSVGVLRSDF